MLEISVLKMAICCSYEIEILLISWMSFWFCSLKVRISVCTSGGTPTCEGVFSIWKIYFSASIKFYISYCLTKLSLLISSSKIKHLNWSLADSAASYSLCGCGAAESALSSLSFSEASMASLFSNSGGILNSIFCSTLVSTRLGLFWCS